MNQLVPNNKFACTIFDKKYGLQQEYPDNCLCCVKCVYQNSAMITAPHSEFQILHSELFTS